MVVVVVVVVCVWCVCVCARACVRVCVCVVGGEGAVGGWVGGGGYVNVFMRACEQAVR